jgi:hypothetical protein
MMMKREIPSVDELNAMTDQQYKTVENRLRQAAARQNLRLVKSRVRDPRAPLYGTYMLVDVRTGGVVFANWDGLHQEYGLDLEDIAEYLFGDRA